MRDFRRFLLAFIFAALTALGGALESARGAENDAVAQFDRVMAPLLARRCLECHNPSDKKGGLDLTTRESLQAGGDSGPVIVDNDPNKSPLFARVAAGEMPPPKAKKPAVTFEEKTSIKNWIAAGAPWGSGPIDIFRYTTDRRAGTDWWSLQPVKRPALPEVVLKEWVRNPIDRFVLAKLEAKGLAPALPCDPRLLIRRVYFDLIGLPPTPAEIDAFVADKSAAAYEKLIDRLLASPHYGERRARHWLDVARYTESQGFEYDRLRPNAWHYRDYLINALNSDKPYNIFVQEQIAGDVMNFASPQAGISSEGMIATSLLVCGPWDQAGNAQSNVTQRMVTREDELEDLVSVVGQTFLGMTINCARCHSHKFDPISQEDYHRFKAVFAGVKHGERVIAPPAEIQKRDEQIAELNREIVESEQEIAALERVARQKAAEKIADKEPNKPKSNGAAPSPLARWAFETDARDSIGEMHGQLLGGATIRNGRLILSGDQQFMRTAPLKQDLREKTLEAWLALPTLDQGGGGALSIEQSDGGVFDAIVFAERQPKKWLAGSNFYKRTIDLNAEAESAGADELIQVAIVYSADNSIAVYRNGKRYAAPYQQDSLQTYKTGDGHVLLGLRHTGAGRGYLKAEIASASIYDRALSDDEIAACFAAGAKGGPAVTNAQILAAMSETQRQQHAAAISRLAELRKEIAARPALETSYVGVREQPPPTHLLVRGDVKSPAALIAPGALFSVKTPSPDFGLTPDAPEAERRIKLAQWLADPRNPLPARVMVNRLWHYHFGRGIVETPNDFGFNGARPSNPELLDWLAAEFVDSQPAWSIKQMHKLILMSATYRQASTFNQRAASVDGDNALLWRFTPQRLEGEIIRDSMLAVSGQLNPALGGPSFKPFTVTNHGSDFYQLQDMLGPEFNRRTIYRVHVNSGKSALMDALDCPDPAIKTPARRVTTTPIAALALMNNSFVQRQAKYLAERATAEAGGDETKAIALTYRIALGRAATEQETTDAALFVRDQGLPTLCWALLNSTEFMYVK